MSQIMPLLTVKELMACLKVSHRTIYRLMERPGFPRPVKLGGQIRFRPEDITQYLTEQQN